MLEQGMTPPQHGPMLDILAQLGHTSGPKSLLGRPFALTKDSVCFKAPPAPANFMANVKMGPADRWHFGLDRKVSSAISLH